MNKQINKKGFTLLELLIVISIIAILSVILIVALNPAETLRKARDTQRLSDTGSLKTALGIYVTSISSPQLDGTSGTANALCQDGTKGTFTGSQTLWYTVATATATITGTLHGNTVGTDIAAGQVATLAEIGEVDGTGWVPVNLTAISGGSPISNMPQDPTNDITAGTSAANAVTNEALVYRYACFEDDVSFEINATLESTAFGPGSTDDDKSVKDGGNHALLYEVGTALDILANNNTY